MRVQTSNPVRQILDMAERQNQQPGALARQSGAGRASTSGRGASSAALPSAVTTAGTDPVTGEIYTIHPYGIELDALDDPSAAFFSDGKAYDFGY